MNNTAFMLFSDRHDICEVGSLKEALEAIQDLLESFDLDKPTGLAGTQGIFRIPGGHIGYRRIQHDGRTGNSVTLN